MLRVKTYLGSLTLKVQRYRDGLLIIASRDVPSCKLAKSKDLE